MSDKILNEIAPWGKTWGRTSKSDYRNIVINLSMDIQKYQGILYARDLFYNPCHDLEGHVKLEKDLNKD